MSPAPKRGKRAARAATATATKKKPGKKRAPVVEDDDDEDDEDEAPAAKKSGKRVAKDYNVTGEQLAEWREDGMGWQEIMDEVGAKSAIPLRKILHAYQAEQDEDEQLDIDDGDAIVAARDEEGMGWSQIAARANSTVAEVKAAYTEAGGENLDGRAYKSKDGTVHFKLGQNGKAELEDEDEDEDEEPTPKKRKKSGKKAKAVEPEPEEEDEEEDDEDDEEEEEAPAPKRRGRSSTAVAPAKRPAKAATPRGRKKK